MSLLCGGTSQYGRGIDGWGTEGWHSGLVRLITWTCVLGAHRRCHPRGGDTDPASASSGPGSVLRRYKMEELFGIQVRRVYHLAYCITAETTHQ